MPNIGEQLRETRESRKLTIKQVVQATRIRAHYIEAMESGDFSQLPSSAQARGFLRSYADFLGLDAEALIASQRGEDYTPQSIEPEPVPLPIPELEPIPEPEATPLQPPVFEAETPKLSDAILGEIGSSLRQRRELLGLTLEEIERHTRIRKASLALIENGDFGELPSPVQARGMLGAYAAFLDMDSDAILLRFAESLQARRVERQPAAPRSNRDHRLSIPGWLKNLVSPDIVFSAGMIITATVLFIWGASRLVANSPANLEPTEGPSISDVLLATASPGAEQPTEAQPTSLVELLGTPLAVDVNIAPTETEITVQFSAVQVTFIALERTYMRVVVDGEIKQDGRVAPGAALTFEADEYVEIVTGNGAAIQVILNQKDLGRLGNFGEVIDLVYTLNGPRTPTPTPSPTPTNTPRFQRTPTATPTLPPATATALPGE